MLPTFVCFFLQYWGLNPGYFTTEISTFPVIVTLFWGSFPKLLSLSSNLKSFCLNLPDNWNYRYVFLSLAVFDLLVNFPDYMCQKMGLRAISVLCCAIILVQESFVSCFKMRLVKIEQNSNFISSLFFSKGFVKIMSFTRKLQGHFPLTSSHVLFEHGFLSSFSVLSSSCMLIILNLCSQLALRC